MKVIRKRQKKTGDYIKFEIRFEPLIKEMLQVASKHEGVSLAKYVTDAAVNRMTSGVNNP